METQLDCLGILGDLRALASSLKGSELEVSAEAALQTDQTIGVLKAVAKEAGELAKQLTVALHAMARAEHDATGKWLDLGDGRQLEADYGSPKWSFNDAGAAAKFYDDVVAVIVGELPDGVAPAKAVEITAAKLGQVYPVDTASISIRATAAVELGVDPNKVLHIVDPETGVISESRIYRTPKPGDKSYKIAKKGKK